jgi:nucleotide-binding universal stress UspA family protein
VSILVGVNPGRRSVSVLQLAALLARSADTDLVVAAVVARGWPPMAAGIDGEWRRYATESAQVVLDHAASVLGTGVAAQYLVHEAASARRGLLELAEERSPSILVVGSSPAGPFGRVALGSVNDALLHTSPVPVAIAPRGFRTRANARVSRITAAYGGTDAVSGHVIVAAAGVAAGVNASLRVASFAVRPGPVVTAGTGTAADQGILDSWVAEVRTRADGVLGEVASLPRPPATDGVVVGIGAHWAEAIDEVGWADDDVLVIGSSTLAPLKRVFLGSRATAIVRHAPVPVVVVPRREAEALADQAQRA